jgi:hypothetical protein
LSISFVIESWAACAPGLDTPQRWSQWAAAPWLPEGEPQMALTAVAPMLRRRFSPLGRLAAQAAFDVAGASAAGPGDGGSADLVDDVSSVFASRYGETSRCLDLLLAQTRGEPLSPTAFALSVHNATGATIAIARADRRNSSAVAAGRLTAAAGVGEAIALLDDGAQAVDLVAFDAPLPTTYAEFQDEPSAHFAWAWRLRRPRAGEPALHLAWGASDAAANADNDGPPTEDVARLPASLQVLWFALSGSRSLVQGAAGQCCHWSRRG